MSAVEKVRAKLSPKARRKKINELRARINRKLDESIAQDQMEGFGMDDELKKILNVLVYMTVTMLAASVLFAIAIFALGCQDEDCPDVDTKCNGHRLMMCAGGDWEELDNCATLYYLDGGTSDGVCCETSEGAECREKCE